MYFVFWTSIWHCPNKTSALSTKASNVFTARACECTIRLSVDKKKPVWNKKNCKQRTKNNRGSCAHISFKVECVEQTKKTTNETCLLKLELWTAKIKIKNWHLMCAHELFESVEHASKQKSPFSDPSCKQVKKWELFWFEPELKATR